MALRQHYAMKPTAAEAGSMIYPSDLWGGWAQIKMVVVGDVFFWEISPK